MSNHVYASLLLDEFAQANGQHVIQHPYALTEPYHDDGGDEGYMQRAGHMQVGR